MQMQTMQTFHKFKSFFSFFTWGGSSGEPWPAPPEKGLGSGLVHPAVPVVQEWTPPVAVPPAPAARAVNALRVHRGGAPGPVVALRQRGAHGERL